MDLKQLPTNSLHFDTQNPRLAEYGITSKTTEDEILEILWDAMDVQEIVLSISASGFFKHEALIVSEENGKFIVIEGNRRLAALKVLLEPEISSRHGWPVFTIGEDQKKALENVPCMMSDRESAWKYLGFKHVNGPAKWTSYAKAKYIAKVKREFGVSLSTVANQIGDRHNTVQRLYRGLMVLEQAEKYKVYNREDRWNTRLFFSHLYTGLDREGIRNFLDLAPMEEETSDPVPEDKVSNLGELCVWLFGNKKDGIPPVIKNQNPDLKHLAQVINSREAVAALRSTNDLEVSYEISRPSGSVFEESLLAAKRNLTKARAHLTTGFDKSQDLLRTAEDIADTADDIVAEMQRKMRDQKKRRSEED